MDSKVKDAISAILLWQSRKENHLDGIPQGVTISDLQAELSKKKLFPNHHEIEHEIMELLEEKKVGYNQVRRSYYIL